VRIVWIFVLKFLFGIGCAPPQSDAAKACKEAKNFYELCNLSVIQAADPKPVGILFLCQQERNRKCGTDEL